MKRWVSKIRHAISSTGRRAGASFALTLGVALPAQAQEIILTGPLVPTPTTRENPRLERFELAVAPGMMLGSNDEPSLLSGCEARYYVMDGFGAGLFGAGAFPLGKGKASVTAITAPEFVVVPVSGRTRTMFDGFRYHLSLFGGPALSFGRREGEAENAVVPLLGVGYTGFIDRHLSLALEYRVLVGDPERHLVTLSTSWWTNRRLED